MIARSATMDASPPTERSSHRHWNSRREDKRQRLEQVAPYVDGKLVRADSIVALLGSLLRAGDRVALEGDNQKQADFLSRSLVQVDPARVHDLHLLVPSVSRPEHLTLFERGIARRLDFSFSGPAERTHGASCSMQGKLEIGSIHTYIELYARMFVDLTPQVALVCAEQADRDGNLYTGANTEDTPTIVEATAFRHGVVLAQVNEVVDELPRVDIPGSWVDLIVQADRPVRARSRCSRATRHVSAICRC